MTSTFANPAQPLSFFPCNQSLLFSAIKLPLPDEEAAGESKQNNPGQEAKTIIGRMSVTFPDNLANIRF